MSRGTRLGILLLSLSLCLLYRPHHYVGWTIDDARYILRAQSLLHGRYASLETRGQPLTNFPLPGYPLLLTPFVALLQPHWPWMQGVALLFTALSIGLYAGILRRWMPVQAGAIAVALYALNPLVIQQSTLVMPDIPFTVFILAVVFLLQEKLDWELRHGLLLGVLLGWAALIRTEGLVLAVSVGLALVLEKRWKTLGQSLAMTAGITGVALLRNLSATHEASDYLYQWHSSLGNLQEIPAMARNGGQWLMECAEGLFHLPMQPPLLFVLLQSLIGVLLVGSAGYGFRARLQQGEGKTAAWTAALFVLLYSGVHSLWQAFDLRYVLPLLPILFGFSVYGLRIWSGRSAARRAASTAAGLILIGWFLVTDGQAILGKDRAIFPGQTFEWIRQHTAEKDILFSPVGAPLYLYTHRTSVSIAAVDQDSFRYWLLDQHVSSILARSETLISYPIRGELVNFNSSWQREQSWISSSPAQYERVYDNSDEQTAVYHVKSEAYFYAAYQLYLSAMSAIRAGDTEKAQAQLREAIRRDPRLPAAYNALGTLLFLTGQDKIEAEKLLHQAIRIRPDYAMAWLNLGRLYRDTGRLDLARTHFDLAIDWIQRSGDFAELLPAIERERNQL